MSKGYRHSSVEDCVASGEHLVSCDNDGYCNNCGEQHDDEVCISCGYCHDDAPKQSALWHNENDEPTTLKLPIAEDRGYEPAYGITEAPSPEAFTIPVSNE